jgi:hypothetical protein
VSEEQDRIEDEDSSWRTWGPYLSERGWGTVREDYSPNGTAWDYFPHDAARSRVYRWNEDGLAGICDDQQRMCFSLALWNGQDPILKERLFGLTGPQGNHGEDVKEIYYYLDNTPSHSYMKMLYRYPQRAYPYQDLIDQNRRRTRLDDEYELIDTGVFNENRFFDVFVEYAKAGTHNILIQISVVNRGPEAADIQVLPTLWFRNTWSWGWHNYRPIMRQITAPDGLAIVEAEHESLGHYHFYAEGAEELLFTHNETNNLRLYNAANASHFVKDAFHNYVVKGDKDAVNPAREGTKMAALYRRTIQPGETSVIRLRMSSIHHHSHFLAPYEVEFSDFDHIFKQRKQEADDYYAALAPAGLTDEERQVQRQALAGMLWGKQFYYYDVQIWLEGDPAQPPPPPDRKNGRNKDWITLNNADVLSMPDNWEYPWYASWDLSFHCIPLALVDSQFAKDQLDLLTREWYQHPNGQIPAYEWAFSDVNPPVLAWSAYRVYKIEQKQRGKGDRFFLERLFHKLLISFTWWVNRKDSEGNNIFQGGFLGLDNIGVFDRSAELPTGGFLEQSDGTSWMGMFSLNMMQIALELAVEDRVYEDIATKFFEHFLYIAGAMNNIANSGISLWDEEDQFFYDVLHLPNGDHTTIKIRSLVGLIPLLAVETIDPEVLDKMPGFKERLVWFLENRPKLAGLVSRWHEPGQGDLRLMAMVRGHRMKQLLKRMLDPNEFLSEYGIRSLSKYHKDHPYILPVGGINHEVEYWPAESRTGLFGGNSNWRGPVWFPINFLIIESLQKFHHYYGDDFKVECPTGSGQMLTLWEVADELSRRLCRLFLRDKQGQRPFNGPNEMLQKDPRWSEYMLFYDYLHGDIGAGLGASHQTGWTGLVAKLIQQQGEGVQDKPGS